MLAAFFAVIGFPDSMHSVPNVDSIASLYSVPRWIMGGLAVVDTVLIYMIAELRYKSERVALIASLLFAVMPITWLTRMVVLDAILLPFLLSSILFALYAALKVNHDYKRLLLILLSGSCLGLAMFTKAPAFTMIPIVGYLVLISSSSGMRKPPLKSLAIWFTPVILIPMLWPIYALTIGAFESWWENVILQAQRKGDIDRLVQNFYSLDPVLFLLGAAGFVYAAIRRDYFLLLWFVPYFLFLSSGVYTQDFHWIPILPVFCIAGAVIVNALITYASRPRKYLSNAIAATVISTIALFGLVSTVLLISPNFTSAQFEAIVFVLKQMEDDSLSANTTIVSSPAYSWVFAYVFDKEHVFEDYRDLLFHPVVTDNIILIADPHFLGSPEEQLKLTYNNTKSAAIFKDSRTVVDVRVSYDLKD